MSEIGGPSSGMPITNQTACNTDHTKDGGPKSSFRASRDDEPIEHPHTDGVAVHADFYDSGLQQDSDIRCEGPTNVAFLYFGAQFDTEASDAAGQADGVEATTSALAAITPDACHDALGFDSESLVSSGNNTLMIAMKYLDVTPDEDQIQEATGFGSQPSAGLPTYDYQRPRIIVVDQEGRTVIPVADDLHRSLLNGELITPAAIVKDVYGLAQAFYGQWMPKLASAHELYAKCAAFTPGLLFRTGLQTLRSCYRGILPTMFEELFALMLVAFAFSHVIYKDGLSCYWDGFSQDVYRWHHAMSYNAETSLFVMAWHRLWCPQASREVSREGTGSSNAILLTSSSVTRLDSDLSDGVPQYVLGLSDPSPRQQSLGQGENNLVKVLMGGMAIDGCSRFLDGMVR